MVVVHQQVPERLGGRGRGRGRWGGERWGVRELKMVKERSLFANALTYNRLT